MALRGALTVLIETVCHPFHLQLHLFADEHVLQSYVAGSSQQASSPQEADTFSCPDCLARLCSIGFASIIGTAAMSHLKASMLS